ncbi:MAG: GTP cyclohydrolase II [Thermoguttaceae bacterium]|nr:GTP cyclohydrolase II [Thermoguttaceae bacterium]MBR4751198.1 GTP cyclohydrolase II [Thermoguttaceae bacterium]
MDEQFNTIEEAIESFRKGEIVIVMDDADRENEGDFICAAEKVTPEHVNFMLKYGRGQTCVPLLPDTCRRLNLTQMVQDNTAPLHTAFTVPVDHVKARTGITAQEKAMAVRALADPDSKITDFVRPGHLFPLEAKEGGVLRRAGHTETAVDLARLAGLFPAGLLTEILDETGDRATTAELIEIAKRFNLKIVTVAALIKYRRQHEKIVDRVAEADLPTKYGQGRIYGYKVKYEPGEPIAIVYGDLSTKEAPLVRLHSSCFTGDLVASLRCDCGDQLHLALQKIQSEGVGALIYLPQEGRGIGLVEKIKAYALQDKGMDTCEANLALGYPVDLRDYGVGIQILKDLGLHKIRLMTNNSKKVDAFIYSGFDLEVAEQIPLQAPCNEHNRFYLETKRDKMGHTIDPSI